MNFDQETAHAVVSLLQDERFKKVLAFVATEGDNDMKHLLSSRDPQEVFYFQGRVSHLHDFMNAMGGAERTIELFEEQDSGTPST